MIWWYWMFLGLALVGAEMASPGGFYLLFFGIAAVMVGALTGLDVITADWLQWLLFSIVAILSLLLLRGPLIHLTQRHPPQAMDTMIGETAILLDELQPDTPEKPSCVVPHGARGMSEPFSFRQVNAQQSPRWMV